MKYIILTAVCLLIMASVLAMSEPIPGVYYCFYKKVAA